MDMRMPTRMKLFAAASFGLCLGAASLPARAQGQRANHQAAGSSDQSSKVASISGTVTSAATGEPLRKARAQLLLMGQRGAQPTVALTDSTGHFTVDSIQPGQYILTVERDSYVVQQYGQDQPGKPGAVLTLAAGQKLGDLSFRLQKCAAISGRVVDETGEPIEHAQIRLIIRNYRGGKQNFDDVGQGMSDDHGEYRVYDIRPGRYYIMAIYQGRTYGEIADDFHIAYVPVYYPNAISADRASPIEVKAADEIAGIDFSLTGSQVTAYEVSGKVINTITGKFGPGSMVMLTARSADEPRDFGHDTAVNPQDGTFRFSDVLPGDYQVTAMSNENGQRHDASEDITVGSSNLQNISLVITQGIDIAGRVTLEGVRDTSGISVALNRPGMNFVAPPRATVQPDGTFVLKGVTDGKYNIRVASQCNGCYIKSATSRGVDLLSSGIQISSDMGPSSVEIVFSGNTAELSGTVTGSGDIPAAGAFVALIPADDMPNRDDHFETSTTDQYGRFDISGIVPGRYEAYALDKVDQDAEPYRDPDFLKPFAQKGRSVYLSESDHKSIQLDLIATENQ
jgi:protocatechuate 3,4-dioxygenase beta subunit